MKSAPRSCFRLGPLEAAAAVTTDFLEAAGASGREAAAGAEATPPAMEEEEERTRPENQEVEAGGEVIVTAAEARLTAWASRVGWLAAAAGLVGLIAGPELDWRKACLPACLPGEGDDDEVGWKWIGINN